MGERITDDDLELLGELGVETEATETGGKTPRQQRIIAGFEDIERFFTEHQRLPQHGEGRDIFERMYAVRLDQIRASAECVELLKPLDKHGLLAGTAKDAALETASDDELLAALGVEGEAASDVAELKHVRPHVERQGAEEVAQRVPCKDFEKFRPIFEDVQKALQAGTRQTAKFQHNGELESGDMFILDGQKVLVAGPAGDWMMKSFERKDRRLRVVFDNGTESNLLHRSLQRALYKNERNRRILPLEGGGQTLFSGEAEADDVESGVIYVLRSLSTHPFIAEHRDTIHKIGVTGNDVKKRIAHAKKDPTYLLADVEVVAEFKLANIKRKALEALLHKLLGPARLDVDLKDRFGSDVEPREWFLVPLKVVDDIIERIKDGSITGYRYDPTVARLVKA
jgi:hypothetical protein